MTGFHLRPTSGTRLKGRGSFRGPGRALLLVAAALAGALYPATAQPASTLVVTNTNDDGPGSLRQALLDANGDGTASTIVFHIPATDPGFDGQTFTIRLTGSALGLSEDRTTIDASTQTAFTGDTNPQGPEVAIDGSLSNQAPFTTIGFFVPSS